MSKIEKLKQRLLSRPNDFSWHELERVLIHLGFVALEGSGSRVKFVHQDSGVVLSLHRPHPSQVLKIYMVRLVVEKLKLEGLIAEDKK